MDINDVIYSKALINPTTEVGVVHSSFFWGYIVTQVPSGYLASIVPPYQ